MWQTLCLDARQDGLGLGQHLLGAALDQSAALEFDLAVQVFHGAKHVLGVLDGQEAVLNEGSVDGFGHHAEQVDVLPGHAADRVEQCVLNVTLEDVAGHVLGRRHVFQAGLGKHLAHQLRVGQLPQETVFQLGVDLEGVTEADLIRLQAREIGELLIDELRGQHGVGRVIGVGGGQVVVFAGVDDDAGIGIDHAREKLVDEGALHVDVAEDDAVHRVVEHHVEPLHGAHGGDLRHTQARAVVGQADVAAYSCAHLVKGGAHQPEVLLGCEGAAKAFSGGAVRHVVEQALTGGADHGDDVGALFGSGARLLHVLEDIACGHDQVQPGFGAFAEGLDHGIARGALPGDVLAHALGDGVGLVARCAQVLRQGQAQGPRGHLLGNLLHRQAVRQHGPADDHRSAVRQQALLLEMLDHAVG